MAGAACLSLADNTGAARFGLRISQLNFSTPVVLGQGTLATFLPSFLQPSLTSCGVSGQATFNWLLEFDSAAGKLRTGGARPVQSASSGYTFANEMIAGVKVQPATYDVTLGADGKFSSKAPQDFVMPVFLDITGTNVILLPLQKVSFSDGQISTDHTCIGSYNAQGLSADNGCKPTPAVPLFLNGAQIGGAILLEDADKVPVSPLPETLCVLLANDGGDGNMTLAKCKRDNQGKILFQGDWCAATNQPAAAGCADAVHVAASFAASGVKING